MRFYHYILIIFFFIFAARIYYLFFRKAPTPKPVKNKVIEGFESYSNCLDQGYPDDFCMRSPLEACVTNCPISTIIPRKFNVFK